MTRRPEKPDFIADPLGNVEDVRHLKYSYDVCPRCGEEYEEQLDVCWNCGTSRDGRSPSRSFEFQKAHLTAHENDTKSLFSLAGAGGMFFYLLGGGLVIFGIALAIGNESGLFPTASHAGCLTQIIGWVIIAVGKVWLEDRR